MQGVRGCCARYSSDAVRPHSSNKRIKSIASNAAHGHFTSCKSSWLRCSSPLHDIVHRSRKRVQLHQKRNYGTIGTLVNSPILDEYDYYDEEKTEIVPTATEDIKRKKWELQAYEISFSGKIYKAYSKTELLKELGVSTRDLHVIYQTTPHTTILIRDKAILMNLLDLKAIVQADRLLLPNYTEASRQLSERITAGIMEREKRTGSDNFYYHLPFELLAFDVILFEVMRMLDSAFAEIRPTVHKHLELIRQSPEGNYHEELLGNKKSLNRLQNNIKAVKMALSQLWESDEDMSSMYLTEKRTIREKRNIKQHEEVETLLEDFIAQLYHLSSEVKQLQEEIEDTDEFVTLQLDRVRNKMMRWTLMLTMSTLGTSCCGLVAGTFGMNLQSSFEHHPHMFKYVACGIFGLGTVSLVASFVIGNKLGKVTKISFGNGSYKNNCKKKEEESE